MSPLIVILGETASGKSALALELALKFGGEIICADSRTIYKGMDIGTAKPTAEDRMRVPHHLLDVIEPGEQFSAAQFKTLAVQAIDDIVRRGKVPFLVGGTGLYIDAVLFDLQFRTPADPMLRAKLEQLDVKELQSQIIQQGYAMPENNTNKRYLIRVLEAGGVSSERSELRPGMLVLGKYIDRETLERRIVERVDLMVAVGFVAECRWLIEKYGDRAPALNAPGYKAFIPHVHGQCTLVQAKEQFVRNDLRLAKKQRTWFRRDVYQNVIHFVSNSGEAVDLVTTHLNK